MSIARVVQPRYAEQSLGEEGGCDPQSLVEIFHEATKYWRSNLIDWCAPVVSFLADPRLIERAARGFNYNPMQPRVRLEGVDQLMIDFSTLVHRRTSTRSFERAPLNLHLISSLLHHALRSNRKGQVTTNGADAVFHYRPYPSGGGLYPVEHYLVPLRVSDLEPCISHYDPRMHELSIVRSDLEPDDFFAALPATQGVQDASLAVISTAVFQRSIAKYGARGYRFALLEAGSAGQVLCLSAAAHGLASTLWGGYFDNEINALCGADGVNESVISLLFIGHPKAGADSGISELG
jgi:SagB-type dehydrogenase family enzyme